MIGERPIPYSAGQRDLAGLDSMISVKRASWLSLPSKSALALPPRIASHSTLPDPLGLPSRISLIVKPYPIPCSTRKASKKLDLPLALAPIKRFSAPNWRLTSRRLLKFLIWRVLITPSPVFCWKLHGNTAWRWVAGVLASPYPASCNSRSRSSAEIRPPAPVPSNNCSAKSRFWWCSATIFSSMVPCATSR